MRLCLLGERFIYNVVAEATAEMYLERASAQISRVFAVIPCRKIRKRCMSFYRDLIGEVVNRSVVERTRSITVENHGKSTVSRVGASEGVKLNFRLLGERFVERVFHVFVVPRNGYRSVAERCGIIICVPCITNCGNIRRRAVYRVRKREICRTVVERSVSCSVKRKRKAIYYIRTCEGV